MKNAMLPFPYIVYSYISWIRN